MIIVIRWLAGVDDGVSPLGIALAAASYPPLIAVLARRWRPAVRHGLLAAVVALALMPFAVVGTDWEWFPWTIAAGVLCVLPARAAWPLFGLILAATGAGRLLGGVPFPEWILWVCSTAIDALILFSLHTLSGMVRDLHTARDELARLATLRERLRLDGELRAVVDGELRAIAARLTWATSTVTAARAEIGAAVEAARRTMNGIREMTNGYRSSGGPQPSALIESPKVARLILLAAILIQSVRAILAGNFASGREATWLLLYVLVLGAAVVLFMLPPSRVRLAVIGLLVVPLSWPGMVFVEEWSQIGSVWGFFLGAAVAWLRPRHWWPIVVTVETLHTLAFFFPPPVPSPAGMATNYLSDLILAWLFYSLTRLGDLVALLDRARHDLAQAAVAAERRRIARDLHDMLGFSLSAVALRGELVLRLLDREPMRAEAELASLVALVEQARTDLGSITSGRIRLLLDQEIDTARETLTAAGIDTSISLETWPAGEVETDVAAVLRESVTNVLRHSRARTCSITITGPPVRLRVVNDGAAAPSGRGTGLASLAVRAGGRLEAGPRPGGRFEVVAEFASEPAGLRGDADGVDAVAGT
ncbi:histidine kinase [Nonomuraea sp. NPDC049784]|uniref:sensor histidine kinase n=1 Tax=Nonomuraea sp. NPDC049784 TaxID=3154361 RepID=UPI0033C2AC85